MMRLAGWSSWTQRRDSPRRTIDLYQDLTTRNANTPDHVKRPRWAICTTEPVAHAKEASLSTPSVISVVDDDAAVRAALNNLLLSRGYIVHTFGSAEEFLGSAQLNDTSCVIADVQMSAMSGLELLANMRMRGYAAPFIVITAFPDESVRARAMKAGASGFFAKPFVALKLIACLDAALRSRDHLLS
jgi:CheY-like chemotaxis protein